jgi:hypothetical protein
MRSMLITVCLLVFTAAANAQIADLMTIAVMDLSGNKISKSDLSVLTDRLRAELFKTGQFRVMEREKMTAILKEQGFQKSGCTSEECAVEIGKLINVRKIVGGRVGKIGSVYSMSIRLIDVESGEIERTAVKDHEGALADVLKIVIRGVAMELAGLTASGPELELKRSSGFGMLYIESNPSGATIWLNGRERTEKTSAMLKLLPAGEHVIRLTSAHLIAQRRVEVIADDLVKLNLRLEPGKGGLFIESRPPGAEVLIDGRNAGTSPLMIKSFIAGRHKLEMRKDGHLPWSESIVVNFGRRTDISAALQPCGWLTVEALLPRLRVFLNGTQLASGTALSRYPVQVGKHKLVIEHPDCVTFKDSVQIRHSEVTTVKDPLTCQPATIAIDSWPKGAEVTSMPEGVNGFTPFVVANVTPGLYRIRANAPNYYYSHQDTLILPGSQTKLMFVLKKTDIAKWEERQVKEQTGAIIYYFVIIPLLLLGTILITKAISPSA